jgi:ribosomal protein S18 acetylase RimI-like enzyme
MRLRRPVHEDAAAVLAMIVARDMVDLGMPDYTLEDLHDAWGASSFDLATDAVVAESDDGSIVGYAVIEAPGTQAVVSPEHEGLGIGARLLDWSERRDRELGRVRHRQGIPSTKPRPGIATTLLSTAFARFASAGLGHAQLAIASDNPGALRLYERCGMTPRFRLDTYERLLIGSEATN